MPRTSAAAALILMLCTTACRVERTERPPLADPGSAARAGIETALQEFQLALRERDAHRATAFFATDGTLALDGRAERRGRGEIARGIEQALLEDSVNVALTSEAIDVASGIAWQTGIFRHESPDSTAGGTGRFVIRWQRGPDATWRMHRVLLARFPGDTAAPSTP